MIKFSNPRVEATFTAWPLGGNKRGPCRFWVEFDDRRGFRFGRQTTGKPKYHTFNGPACIVDGDDSRTYLLQCCAFYDFITISASDFMNADSQRLGHDASVFSTEIELHAELMGLIQAAQTVSHPDA